VGFSALFGKKREKDTVDARKPALRTTVPAADPAATSASTPGMEPVARPVATATVSSGTVEGSAPPNAPTVAPTAAPTAAPHDAGSVAWSARDVARATAEKIDRIESEMALDFTSRNNLPPVKTGATPEPAQAGNTVQRKRRNPDGSTTMMPSLGRSTDILLGDSILANAMELSDSASNPAIEEAAILYANGQALPAATVLIDAIRADMHGPITPTTMQAWLMLFDLHQVLGKKAEFESLGIDFTVRFDVPAPVWRDDQAPAVTAAQTPAGVAPAARAVISFKGTLDAGIVPLLDQLKRLAQKSPVLWLEFDKVTGVDPTGAGLMLRVFAAFQKSNHEVVIVGGQNLSERCRAAIEVGRRDASNAVWMLLFETYRLLQRQAAFEETSIDYCVTYEVSPPAWEAAPARFRIADAAPAPVAPARPVLAAAELVSPNTITLQGDLIGKLEVELQKMNQVAASGSRIIVDCTRLRRVDFTAAGALLNWAVGIQASGNAVEFRQVGHLIAALLVVMGLHEVAQIERKKN